MLPETTSPGIGKMRRPERRGLSRRSVIEAAKASVETIALADLLCGPGKMRKVGERWVSRCPLPDHEDRSPSFTVYPGAGGWFCYGCLRGGDVIELARFAWGYQKAEVATAAADLLRSFGHEIPERPPSWYAKQKRQRPIRDRIEAQRIEHVQMLVFRLLFVPWLRQLPEFVRQEASESAWTESLPIARMLYEQRGGV